MQPITITSIPHSKQRYDTMGDWYLKNGIWRIVVDKGDEEERIAIHELVEMMLCLKRGISEKAVTEFDLNYKGADPGRSRQAPYHHEHEFANKVERMLHKELIK